MTVSISVFSPIHLSFSVRDLPGAVVSSKWGSFLYIQFSPIAWIFYHFSCTSSKLDSVRFLRNNWGLRWETRVCWQAWKQIKAELGKNFAGRAPSVEQPRWDPQLNVPCVPKTYLNVHTNVVHIILYNLQVLWRDNLSYWELIAHMSDLLSELIVTWAAVCTPQEKGNTQIKNKFSEVKTET